MAMPVELPKLGNTVEECFIARWVKRCGDQVKAGETVVDDEAGALAIARVQGYD